MPMVVAEQVLQVGVCPRAALVRVPQTRFPRKPLPTLLRALHARAFARRKFSSSSFAVSLSLFSFIVVVAVVDGMEPSES